MKKYKSFIEQALMHSALKIGLLVSQRDTEHEEGLCFVVSKRDCMYKDSGEFGFPQCTYHADELCLCLIVVFHVIEVCA